MLAEKNFVFRCRVVDESPLGRGDFNSSIFSANLIFETEDGENFFVTAKLSRLWGQGYFDLVRTASR
jgi:hypothetical protein